MKAAPTSTGALILATCAGICHPPLLHAAEAPWQAYRSHHGATFEKRPVPGSNCDELRATMEVEASPQAVQEAAWQDITSPDSTEDLKKQILRQGPDEVVIYQQIAVPVISDRDYTVRVWKPAPGPDGTLAVRFEIANDLGPAPAKGHVRLDIVRGGWAATPLPNGKTRVVWQMHSDPGGSVPAAFARSSQRERFALDFWNVIGRALKKPPSGP